MVVLFEAKVGWILYLGNIRIEFATHYVATSSEDRRAIEVTYSSEFRVHFKLHIFRRDGEFFLQVFFYNSKYDLDWVEKWSVGWQEIGMMPIDRKYRTIAG